MSYEEDFKREVVKCALEQTQKVACKKYNIASSTLHYWLSKYKEQQIKENKNEKQNIEQNLFPEKKINDDFKPKENKAKYHKISIDPPKKEPAKKILVLCSEDPAQLIEVLKGVL